MCILNNFIIFQFKLGMTSNGHVTSVDVKMVARVKRAVHSVYVGLDMLEGFVNVSLSIC